MNPPHDLPRPEGETETLRRIWQPPRGWRAISAVNNQQIGLFYVATAFVFFLAAGVLALLMRLQLAVPSNTFLDQETYNQIFTMHGTVMMFLFAVPIVEALGVILVPGMIGARDLPFPRLSAYAFWAYLIGGTVFFGTLFFDLSPNGGWFMYPPLTSTEHSPGVGADFWLLGIGFIEISAIAGAIEIIVGILLTRAPGMTLTRMPVFVWTQLIFAAMIIFAFPAIILATMLLELERAFGWPFFQAAKGGDPLLWQHLFWFFGHPEVYIIFLPAAGLVSMIVATMARTPLVGYHLIVVALMATGFFSFGLWVHHMFTTGIPPISLAFFSAASMAVSLPSGIQVFAWIATMANGRLQLTAASLFVLGFVFLFTLGGLTGVMLAMVPFDWQAHDTYFVVAHFHYVLIGGMVFPLFAAIYYWAPMLSEALCEKLGKLAFWLMFLGFNVTFLPMHLTGLVGMPRRVHTYPEALNWGWLNFISTVGAFIFAAGVLVVLYDLVRRLRPSLSGGAGNIWRAGTLEWLGNDTFVPRSIPRVDSRDPLWTRPTLAKEADEGQWYLPNAPTGMRETLLTSPVEAEPRAVIRLAGIGYAHVIAAAGTAGFFLLLTVKYVGLAAACGLTALAAMIIWMWPSDRAAPGGRTHVDIGAGMKVPTYVSGPRSPSWLAIVVLLCAAASLYLSYVFSYLYLWTTSATWLAPAAAGSDPAWLALSAVALAGAFAGLYVAGRCARSGQGAIPSALIWLATAVAVLAALGFEVYGHWQAGLRPDQSSYAAMVYMASVLQGQVTIAFAIMAAFTAAKLVMGRLDGQSRATPLNVDLFGNYVVAQGAAGLLLIHGFPVVAQ